MSIAIQDESVGIVPVYRTSVDPAAGARKWNDEPLFLIVRHKAGHWAFPKGHRDEGESDRDAALRELFEETGVSEVELDQEKTFSERYSFRLDGKMYDKTVRYFLGFARAKALDTPQEFKDEVPDARWVSRTEAAELLTFDEAKQVLEEASEYLETG